MVLVEGTKRTDNKVWGRNIEFGVERYKSQDSLFCYLNTAILGKSLNLNLLFKNKHNKNYIWKLAGGRGLTYVIMCV